MFVNGIWIRTQNMYICVNTPCVIIVYDNGALWQLLWSEIIILIPDIGNKEFKLNLDIRNC